jgi:hypothetical protein
VAACWWAGLGRKRSWVAARWEEKRPGGGEQGLGRTLLGGLRRNKEEKEKGFSYFLKKTNK